MLGCCHVEYKTFDCQEKLPLKAQDVMEKKINQQIKEKKEVSNPIPGWTLNRSDQDRLIVAALMYTLNR